MFSSQKAFDAVREKSEELYNAIGSVRCPYLQQEVKFNVSGLEHLKFKRRGHARKQQDQYMRFKLLRLAPEVIKASRTVQGYCQKKLFERIRVHSRTDTILKQISFYQFDAVLEDVKIRVIVKQVDGYEPIFWSLIPRWRNNSDGTKNLYSGNPEED